ncbi:hypothetical protein [Riemerella anatipestifer]|uniref:hypothetical protein n=1 Tax=Riemerella anatipestifer TaxID=34085 RepID=UPI0015E33FD6|nr:hypothetical protein [Riemerella anatipestifer]
MSSILKALELTPRLKPTLVQTIGIGFLNEWTPHFLNASVSLGRRMERLLYMAENTRL